MSLNQVLPSLVTHAARGPIQPTARLVVLVFTIFYFAILKERFPSPPAAVCFKCCFPLCLASPFHFPLRLHWQTLLGDVEIRRENCLFSVNSPGNGLNDFWSLYNPPPPQSPQECLEWWLRGWAKALSQWYMCSVSSESAPVP